MPTNWMVGPGREDRDDGPNDDVPLILRDGCPGLNILMARNEPPGAPEDLLDDDEPGLTMADFMPGMIDPKPYT